jgi:hypothetical protein
VLLPEPYEYVDLLPGQSILLQVSAWQDGSAVIHPKKPTARHIRIHMDQRMMSEPPKPGEPIANEVPVIRLFGTRLDAASAAPYWDISSKRLRADLLARFSAGLPLPADLKLTANGAAPRKTYSVEVLS